MKRVWDVEMELVAANPAPRERVAELPLAEAERELLGAIVIEPSDAPPNRRRKRPRLRRVHVALLAGAAAAVAVAVGAITIGNRPGEPEPAFAAELVRFAERSPLVLVGQPGWRVEYANEESADLGEMSFRRGGRRADLFWHPGPVGEWKGDRAASAGLTTSAPVLGTTATVYQYELRLPGGDLDITAIWTEQGRVLEFRAPAVDMAAFKRLLGSLRRVDTTTWLNALPASVVKAEDQEAVVREMLRGIPLPPGFDPSSIKPDGLTRERYSLGATVAGTVACTWFQRWAEARGQGDRDGVRAATEALATAKQWPILREMAKQGDYPDVLQEYAAAMPSGDWYGRPLTGDVESGLGCSRLGVDLP